ncbi:MAG TPA: hypothetical protein PKJ13_02700 [bacterium]|nr:hypothetical protein [bacterium]HOC24189.1 hypothetical protein [bacterium]HOH07727.1 hypothetical protein [bacterium]HOY43413.1 hypothetical protein [bacterium]HPG83199.1 hypothetical protein [bacterium]
MSWLDYAALNLGYREWGNPVAVLQALDKEFNLPFLCANVLYKDSATTPFKPYAIRELEATPGRSKMPFKKLTIAMVGLTDNLLAQLFVNRPGEPELLYRDPVEAAGELMPELRGKADLVILLYYGKYQKLTALLEAVPGFDVAVFGGEHYLVASQKSPNNPVRIVSTPSMGKYAGVLTLQLDKKRKIVSSSDRQVPLKEDMNEVARFNELAAEYEKEASLTKP